MVNFLKNLFKKKELTREEKFQKEVEDEQALRNLIISSGGHPGGYSPSEFSEPLGSPPEGPSVVVPVKENNKNKK